jgi:hypothetical protein
MENLSFQAKVPGNGEFRALSCLSMAITREIYSVEPVAFNLSFVVSNCLS